MAATTHGDPKPVDPTSHLNHDDEELWDQNIEALLRAGDIEGARAEFERQCLVSVESGDTVTLEDAAKHRLPGYTVDLLLEKGDIPAAKAELERLVLEGVDSGDPVEMTSSVWKSLRSDLHRRAGVR
jgi:hypothetical protein